MTLSHKSGKILLIKQKLSIVFFCVHVVGCRKAPVAWRSVSMSLPVRSGQGQRLLVSSMAWASRQTLSHCCRYNSSTCRQFLHAAGFLLFSYVCFSCVEKPSSSAGEGGASWAGEWKRGFCADSHHQLQHPVNAQKPFYGAGVPF